MWAALEERGWKRDEIAVKLDRGYMARIIGYPRDEDGKLKRPKEDPNKSERETNPWYKMRDVLRRHGWQDWRIIDYLREKHQEMVANADAGGLDCNSDAWTGSEPGRPAAGEVHPGDGEAGGYGPADFGYGP